MNKLEFQKRLAHALECLELAPSDGPCSYELAITAVIDGKDVIAERFSMQGPMPVSQVRLASLKWPPR